MIQSTTTTTYTGTHIYIYIYPINSMSLNNPSQDLIFFKDNSLISDKIINQETTTTTTTTASNNFHSYLSVITYNQSTSPNWLINGLIEDTLFGNATKSLNNHESYHQMKKKDIIIKNKKIMILSFLHNKEFYIKNCKRIGINLEEKEKEQQQQFQFIDYFNDLFINLIKNPNDSIKDINKMFDNIINSLNNDSKDDVDVIIIEGVEILLFATNITSNQLIFNINRLNKKCRQLFVVSSKECLFKNNESIGVTFSFDDPMIKINDFLIKLLHRSQLNITLEPLITGRAKDITGSLTISKGCIPYDENLSISINEKEYVYHITKDSQVKLYYR